MKVYPEQLGSHLNTRLAPIYIISGDEPLQLMEASDSVRLAARTAGFRGREIFYADTGFDWSRLQEAGDSFSLFGEPRVLDLRLTGKPEKAGAAALMHYVERPPTDAILMISMPRLTAQEQKVRWFQAVERIGVFIQVWPLEGEKLLSWLDRRLNAKGLLASRSGLRLIAARVEGNLLAAAQEIEKLHILFGNGPLSDEQILTSVADSARYDVFDLADQILRGQPAKAYRVLMGLRAEGIAAPVVLWAITRELRLLYRIKSELAAGAGTEAVYARHRVWDSRKAAMEMALARLNRDSLQRGLLLSGTVDRIIKGMEPGDEWDALLTLCNSLTTPQGRSLLPFRA